MNNSANHFLDEILDLEAQGIFQDLSANINLLPRLINFDRTQIKDAIFYIKSILSECYRTGNLRFGAYQAEEKLLGYVLLFVNPISKSSTYLQKVFVHEEYRNRGIGTYLLNGISNSNEQVALLCPKDKINFYKNNGFNYVKPFSLPNTDNFRLSLGFYSDLHLMSTEKEESSAPIFLLNDNDLNIIINGDEKT